jgi:hypothetical protein
MKKVKNDTCSNVRDWRITQQHIADITGLHKNTVISYIQKGELDMDDLMSIAYFIVKRTLSAPKKDKEGRRPDYSKEKGQNSIVKAADDKIWGEI